MGENFKEIRTTVADLRIDVVAAAGYGISRSRMAEEIKAKNVFINGVAARKPSQEVTEGVEINFGKRAKVVVVEVGGTTKKGRVGLVLRRYM